VTLFQDDIEIYEFHEYADAVFDFFIGKAFEAAGAKLFYAE
jgi:hypothetical protein